MSSTENRRWPTDGLRSTLKTIDVEYTATWGQRHRYQSTITLDMTTKDRQCGPMNRRSDYKPTTHALQSLRQEKGRQNPKFRKMRDDEATIRRIRARFQTWMVPYYLARINRSRSKKHGESQWQQDHWKAVDAKRGAKKHNKATITTG